MKIKIELDEKYLRQLVLDSIGRQLGDVVFNANDVEIQVKSKQNWKSEWEPADFRAVIEINR
jgi:hypothetical protein